MLATTGEQGDPITALNSCLKMLPWNVNTQFSRTSLRTLITSFFGRPHVLPVNEQPYLPFAWGSSLCSVKSLLMISRAEVTSLNSYTELLWGPLALQLWPTFHQRMEEVCWWSTLRFLLSEHLFYVTNFVNTHIYRSTGHRIMVQVEVYAKIIIPEIWA